VAGLLLQSSATIASLSGGRLAMRLGKMEAAQHVDGQGGVGLARGGLWWCGDGRRTEVGFWLDFLQNLSSGDPYI
jgi:hypothetical protein